MNIFLSIVVSIASFGAVGNDSLINNADAINSAITYCAEHGGGKVVVPNGEYTTGTIYLKSNVMLNLQFGATLKGSRNIDDYFSLRTDLDLAQYESGRGTVNYNSATDAQWSKAMIFAVGVKKSGIEGEGCIDGADVRNPLGEEHMRGPHTILLAGCRDMKFEGFKVCHSGNYAFLGYQIENSLFRRLQIDGGWDGIHIRGAKRIEISCCTMHTGDDAIAGGYWERMTIRSNKLNSSCNGIRMIMPSDGLDIVDNDIYGPGKYEHITSHRTRSEAAINLEPGGWGSAPGRMDHIRILRNNIACVLTPLSVTLSDENTMGSIRIERLVAHDVTRMALSVKSWGKALTDCVVMRHCDMTFDGIDDPQLPSWFETHSTNEWPVFPVWGMYFRNVDKVDVKRVRLRVKGRDYRKPYMCENVKNVRVVLTDN